MAEPRPCRICRRIVPLVYDVHHDLCTLALRGLVRAAVTWAWAQQGFATSIQGVRLSRAVARFRREREGGERGR